MKKEPFSAVKGKNGVMSVEFVDNSPILTLKRNEKLSFGSILVRDKREFCSDSCAEI